MDIGTFTVISCHKNLIQLNCEWNNITQQYSSAPMQGVKKIIFRASHSGKLKLTFISADVISTSPKSFLKGRIDLTILLLFEFLKKDHLPVGQVKNRIH